MLIIKGSENLKSLPMIHIFNTPKFDYIYDFNSNAILRVNKQICVDIKNYLNTGELIYSNEQSRKEIENLFAMGFLKNQRWQKIEHPSIPLLNKYLNSSISSLTLQVTQNCNLRCEYCPYSGGYNNRKHTNKKMDIETAKKAVDFYIKHSFDLPNINVSFYGGEPLIEFSLIKEIVKYTKAKGFGKIIKFRMTTNATLMNEEIIRFLVENDFNITISLDGPKEIHDKHRRTISNKGTYDIIVKKIEYINRNFPEFINNILINCVIDPSIDFGCLSDYFSNYDEVREYMTNFSNIAREEIKDESEFLASDIYMQNYNFELFKLFMYKLNRIGKEQVSKIVQSYYSHMINVLSERSIAISDSKNCHPGGPCIPGSHKLFVDIYGTFYPCEKLNECSNDVIIGNLKDGFNYDNAEKLLNIGKITESSCKNCWCSKFCYLCVLYSEDNGKISQEKRTSYCESVKKGTENLFMDYCLIKEMNKYEDSIFFV